MQGVPRLDQPRHLRIKPRNFPIKPLDLLADRLRRAHWKGVAMSVTLTQLAALVQSAEGFRATQPGVKVVDRACNFYELVAVTDPTRAPYQIARNGVLDPVTGRVTDLCVHAGLCCQRNVAGLWWYADANGAWIATADPTRPAASPDGTAITSITQYLTDAAGNRFSLTPVLGKGNGIAINDRVDSVTGNVLQLYAKGGLCFQQAAAGWWSYGGSPGQWAAAASPLPVPVPPPQPV